MKDADIIIIGTGAGALAAGLGLAKAGKKVLMLEQHYVPGGWCHSFQMEGFKFSPGVHYIGQLGEGQSTRAVYEGLGIANDMTFFQQNPNGFEHCRVGNESFDYVAGKENLADRLAERFPREAKKIRKFLEFAARSSEELHEIGKMETFMDHVLIPWRTRHLGRYGLFSLKRVMDWYFKDPLLKAFMGIQCGDHGLPPSQVGFTLHSAVMHHYFNGGFYPRGGSAAIVKAFTKAIKSHGGEIKTQARVKKILISGEGEQRKAIGVQLANGEKYYAEKIISNADPDKTYTGMVGTEHLSTKLQKKLNNTKYSVPALNMFLAVDMDLRKVGMDSGNIWYMAEPNLDATYQKMMNKNLLASQEFPGLFLSSPTLKDPTSFNGRHHVLEAVTFINYETFRKFDQTDAEARPEAYLTFKEQLQDRLLNTIERFVPGIRNHLVFCELGTPMSAQYYLNATEGSSYGTAKTLGQIGPFAFRMQSEISGLYLCGASTLAHGVAGATASGINLAAHILECKPDELLQDHHGQKLEVYNAEDSSQWPDWVHEKIKLRQRKLALQEARG